MVGLLGFLRQGRRTIAAHPIAVPIVALAMIILSGADLLEIIPFFAPVVASGPFQFFYGVHDIIALALVLLAIYKLDAVIGIGAGFLFFGLHIPVFYVEFSEEQIDLVRLVMIGLTSIFAAFIVRQQRKAQWLAEQRTTEIGAQAGFAAKVLNERIQFLEEAEQRGKRLKNLFHAISVASQAPRLLDVAQELISRLHDDLDSEYISLTLVRADGTLGERTDSFRGIEPLVVSARSGGLAEEILKTGEIQYVIDTERDTRANPVLVEKGIRSYIGIPLRLANQVAGILFIHSKRVNAFEGEREFLETIASVLALPLLKARQQADMEQKDRNWQAI